jgi:hypothetical protein
LLRPVLAEPVGGGVQLNQLRAQSGKAITAEGELPHQPPGAERGVDGEERAAMVLLAVITACCVAKLLSRTARDLVRDVGATRTSPGFGTGSLARAGRAWRAATAGSRAFV